MEKITSRKNEYIRHVRLLSTEAAYRREAKQYLCDGIKTLREALGFGAQICSVLWKDEAREIPGLSCEKQYIVPADLFDYASPMKNSPGPLFAVAQPDWKAEEALSRVLVLEGVQDPGNVGTVIRSANAFGIDAVVLTGDCADLYNPKTVRSTMGAIFRQRVLRLDVQELSALLKAHGLPLYGAALAADSVNITELNLKTAAVAIGSEGRGLSASLLERCDKKLIIPMRPDSESLNAAVAASVVMWEMAR